MHWPWTQVNVVNYVERTPPAKDFVQLEVVVERESQKGILLGKVQRGWPKVLRCTCKQEFISVKIYMS